VQWGQDAEDGEREDPIGRARRGLNEQGSCPHHGAGADGTRHAGERSNAPPQHEGREQGERSTDDDRDDADRIGHVTR
jgi:hypothetical protein